jgi:dissimilatory sulfite reductase (desulfoviridin) alpha/beta subunit
MAVDYKALKNGGFMRQKQKNHFSLRLKVVGGNLTAGQLAAIAEIAKRYGDGYVHLTSRQGVEIPFIKLNDVETVKADLLEGGVFTGVCGPRVRTVTACQGSGICPSGCIDTYPLAAEISDRYFGRELPHKFKFGVTGCANNCLKAEENDLGIKGGYAVTWIRELCTMCGVCVKACRENAISVLSSGAAAREAAEAGSEIGTEAGSEAEAGAEANSGSSSEAGSAADSDSGSTAREAAEAGSEIGTEAGSEAGAEAGSGSGSAVGVNSAGGHASDSDSELGEILILDAEKCNHCGRCVKSCPMDAWHGESGYILSFGGTFGNMIAKGERLLPIIKDKDALFRAADAALDFFSEHANPSERFRAAIERAGWDKLKTAVEAAVRR